MEISEIAEKMKKCANIFASIDIGTRNKVLENIANSLLYYKDVIFEANQHDMDEMRLDKDKEHLCKRLFFREKQLHSTIKNIEELIKLPDPLGVIQLNRQLDKELILKRVSCPIGVIAIIFEARPDALIQIASLCIKSGNCAILKGGSEAKHTNKAIFDVVYNAVKDAGIPKYVIYQIEERYEVQKILECKNYIDLIIPRGSNNFVRYILEHSQVPVLGHAEGICHIYADENMDIKKGINIILDSKIQYPAACNAVETVLIHKNVASKLLPELYEELKHAGVVVKGCEETRKIVNCELATSEDFGKEFSDYKISIKIVKDVREAVDRINRFSSHHTDCILTEQEECADFFMNAVDSADVFCNCSTRFADGYRFGFGAEVGISTGKLHARGPVGLEGLITYKYKLFGNGHIVSDYVNETKKFDFKEL
ncbi:MAG: glutamate-5-semialdehyde dehydrogenase [Roseburia sp. 1XD42-69]|jgi:gamma-glutamyl phosphate reductase